MKHLWLSLYKRVRNLMATTKLRVVQQNANGINKHSTDESNGLEQSAKCCIAVSAFAKCPLADARCASWNQGRAAVP